MSCQYLTTEPKDAAWCGSYVLMLVYVSCMQAFRLANRRQHVQQSHTVQILYTSNRIDESDEPCA